MSRFESAALVPWSATEELRSFLAGFSRQLAIEAKDMLSDRVAIDYILELTSGVTGRIVEVLRLAARFSIQNGSHTLTIGLLQDVGKEFAADLGSERNINH